MLQGVARHADLQGRWWCWCRQEVWSILVERAVSIEKISKEEPSRAGESRGIQEAKMSGAWCRGHSVIRDTPLGGGGYTEGAGVPVRQNSGSLLRGPWKVITDQVAATRLPRVHMLWVKNYEDTTKCPHSHVTDWWCIRNSRNPSYCNIPPCLLLKRLKSHSTVKKCLKEFLPLSQSKYWREKLDLISNKLIADNKI